MKSIVERNILSNWKQLTGWKTRIDEVQAANEARTKELAAHHFSRGLEGISKTKRASERYSYYASMSKQELKGQIREYAREAVKGVFNSVLYMDRLDAGIAAIRKLGDGDLPPDLCAFDRRIWRTLERFEEFRQRYYSPLNPSTQRLFIELSKEIGPLCDELKSHVIAYYTVAESLYDLPELNGEGMQ